MDEHDKIRRCYYHWLNGLKKDHGPQTDFLIGMQKAAFCAGWRFAKFIYGLEDDEKKPK